jgi:alpha-N-arabinofuranosidase
VKRAAALVAYVNGDLHNTTPLGTDEEGRDWQTVSYWAQKRAAQGWREPFGVRYWEVGNEIFDKSEMGYTTAQRYARDFVTFARAMKEVDPGIQIGAVGLSDPKGRGDADAVEAWNPTVVKLAGESLDFLVIHLYYPSAGPPQVSSYQSPEWFTAIMAGATRALADLKEVRAVINANAPAGSSPGLAVTEYGIWPYASQDPRDHANLAGALYAADLLMGLSREAAPLGLIGATAWNLHGSNPCAAIGYNWDQGTRTVRPQYYVFKILRPLAGLELLETQVTSPTFTVPEVGNVKGTAPVPLLGAVAAAPGDRRRLILLVINRSLTVPVTAAIQLQDFAPQPTGIVQTLSGDRPGSHNEQGTTIVVPKCSNLTAASPQMTYTFSPHSLTWLEFQGQP